MNIIITSGGTSERIDAVRRITNNSTGRLGAAIADKFALEGFGNIFYLCGRGAVLPKSNVSDIIYIEGVDSLEFLIKQICNRYTIDVFVHAMAVSDYTIASAVDVCGEEIDLTNKISSKHNEITLKLKKTIKIISHLREYAPLAAIFGFKLMDNVQHEILISAAFELLKKNNCDFVLANDSKYFSENQHIGYLIDKDKNISKYYTKEEIAAAIVTSALKLRT